MPSAVTQVRPADSAIALSHFSADLSFEADCWDVHDALSRDPDFVLVDVQRVGLDHDVRVPRGKQVEIFPMGRCAFSRHHAGSGKHEYAGTDRAQARAALIGLPQLT